jgi:hypothetical protein
VKTQGAEGVMKKMLFILASILFSTSFAQSTSNFLYTEKIDPITDASLSVLIGFLEDKRANLAFRCTGSNLEIIVTANQYLNVEYSDRVFVLYRFDKNPISDDRWLPSTDQTAVFAWNYQDFITNALSSKTFIIRMQSHLKNDITLVFSLQGFSEGVKKLKCAEKYLPTKY